MDWFDDKRIQQLEGQLFELGFPDPKALTDRLETNEDPNDNSVKGYIGSSLHISNSYEADIAFIIKEDKDIGCKIGTVYIELFINAENFPEGIAPILRRFSAEDGPLPTQSQIIGDLSELLKNEQYKEELYLKSTLASEFQRLGFLNYNTFHWQPTPGENVGHFSIFEKIGVEEKGILYTFIVDSNKDQHYPYIKSITVGMYDSAPDNGFNEPVYKSQYDAVHLPTRAKITWELLAKEKLSFHQVEHIRRRFGIGTSDGESLQDIMSKQIRLRF